MPQLGEQWKPLQELLEQRRLRWRKLLGEVEEWACWLARRLEERGIRVEEILLFGSIARGDFAEDSDVDLVIVSPDWEGMPYGERLSLLYRLWDRPRDATLIPLTRPELTARAARSVALRDASRYWVRVYPGAREKRGCGTDSRRAARPP